MGYPMTFMCLDQHAFSVGEWHHIAATFSKAASRLKFYIDGQMVQVKDINHSQVSTDQRQAITIGREWDESDGSGWTGGNDLYGGRKLRGGVLLRKITVWNAAIAAADVASLFRASVEPESICPEAVVFSIAGEDGEGNVVEVSGKPATITVRTKEDHRRVSEVARLARKANRSIPPSLSGRGSPSPGKPKEKNAETAELADAAAT
jgi:hypothetical protein